MQTQNLSNSPADVRAELDHARDAISNAYRNLQELREFLPEAAHPQMVLAEIKEMQEIIPELADEIGDLEYHLNHIAKYGFCER